MDAQAVRDFTELMAVVRKAMDQYLLEGEFRGIACAAGTLTARLNNLKIMVAAFEDREPNDKDRFELSSLANTLAWLSKDDYVQKDFRGTVLSLADTSFAAAHPEIVPAGDTNYATVFEQLQRAVIEILLGDDQMH